jgi:hypothetical protein
LLLFFSDLFPPAHEDIDTIDEEEEEEQQEEQSEEERENPIRDELTENDNIERVNDNIVRADM